MKYKLVKKTPGTVPTGKKFKLVKKNPKGPKTRGSKYA